MRAKRMKCRQKSPIQQPSGVIYEQPPIYRAKICGIQGEDEEEGKKSF